MRQILNLNTKWAFSKEATAVPAAMPGNWHWVHLPHTWNAIDGQDGGGDYYRGTCYYAKSIDKIDLPESEKYFLEVNGANASATVYWNGQRVGYHAGGYSTWRIDVTDVMDNSNLIVFEVDNSVVDNIYPQHADFTFYGGLYRDVNLICVPKAHFELEYYGTPGIKVTPVIDGDNANVEIEVWTKDAEGLELTYVITDREGNVVAETTTTETKANFVIENVHKWHGRKDPYLYTATVKLADKDAVSARFGCRAYVIDPDRGFILNGEEYPLRGVARHQDRLGLGNALLPEHHAEDVDLIMEVGATTIRLAHYQHNQYFYDLCDEKGLVLWAEIPYITTHLPSGFDNTIQQMTELITQNYNHPSIVVWGLSNEITMKGEDDPDLLENHRILNDLVHTLDKTRLTTMAAISMCPMDAEIIHIPDVVSYNHYFGWYGGETDMNGPWFDKFHAKYPNTPIGCSEYGAEALNWHSSNPIQGDYTEEYQAYYHEELIKTFFSRKYIWATHCWNMFDFGADARSEGGENGQNHKGLITIDRKYKKDAFYAYKAWLSDEPFVHICGKRYVDRVEDVAKVTVYSNLKSVELFANGVSLGVQEAPDHFFRFEVPNAGETNLVAVAGQCRDESVIRKVEVFNEAYRLQEKNAILNWFEITMPEGYFSINDKVGDIMATVRGKMLFMKLASELMSQMPKNKDGKPSAGGFELNSGMMEMMSSFTILRLAGMVGMANITITKEQLLDLNAQLNKIKKK